MVSNSAFDCMVFSRGPQANQCRRTVQIREKRKKTEKRGPVKRVYRSDLRGFAAPMNGCEHRILVRICFGSPKPNNVVELFKSKRRETKQELPGQACLRTQFASNVFATRRTLTHTHTHTHKHTNTQTHKHTNTQTHTHTQTHTQTHTHTNTHTQTHTQTHTHTHKHTHTNTHTHTHTCGTSQRKVV